MFHYNKKWSLVLSAIILSSVFFSTSALAVDYNTDQPMLFTYQNENGRWLGCGPVQCASSTWDSEDRVIGIISQSRHGKFRYLGRVGRCNVYQSSGDLRSYDRQPSAIANLTDSRC